MDNTPKQAALSPARPDLLIAWPRTVQAALACALTLAVLLIALYVHGTLRWSARPSQLEKEAVLTAAIDLNIADRAQLLQIPEVGEGLAAKIEEYRRTHGGFRNIDELAHVAGIGPAKLKAIRPWVYIDAEEGEPPGDARPLAARKPVLAARPKKGEGLNGLLNINQATSEQFQQIPGIGPILAGAILDARRKEPFRKVDDLRRVPGIGSKTLEKIRPFVTVAGKQTDAPGP